MLRGQAALLSIADPCRLPFFCDYLKLGSGGFRRTAVLHEVLCPNGDFSAGT